VQINFSTRDKVVINSIFLIYIILQNNKYSLIILDEFLTKARRLNNEDEEQQRPTVKSINDEKNERMIAMTSKKTSNENFENSY
jgi:hypothetical protein